LNKNPESSFVVLLLPAINAETPARKLNDGAQKWVMNLVRKMAHVV